MADKRHSGFVIGSDASTQGQMVWKVRVKDLSSPHNGRKLIVASVRGGLELAKGLNVNFAIGTVDDRSGGENLRAVDVCLKSTDDQTRVQVNRMKGGQ